MPQTKNKPYTSKDKWILSIMVGLLFMLISSPYLYKITNSIASYVKLSTIEGGNSSPGMPNIPGLILHTIIFTIIVRLLIR